MEMAHGDEERCGNGVWGELVIAQVLRDIGLGLGEKEGLGGGVLGL